MIVNKSIIKDLIPLAKGYKILNTDWTSNYGNNYSYMPDDGKIEGSVHMVEGELEKCKYGLHFCKSPLDCLKFYSMVQWNRFVKVRGYGELVGDPNDTKVAVSILEVVEVLSWDEFLEELKQYASRVNGACDVGGASYVSGAYNSKYCLSCEGISRCLFVYQATGKLLVFNKKVNEKRFDEVNTNLSKMANGWFPDFTNIEKLKKQNGNEYKSTPPHKIKDRTNKEAYADMPSNMIDYIKSIPEFDSGIFTIITGLE